MVVVVVGVTAPPGRKMNIHSKKDKESEREKEKKQKEKGTS